MSDSFARGSGVGLSDVSIPGLGGLSGGLGMVGGLGMSGLGALAGAGDGGYGGSAEKPKVSEWVGE